MQILKTMPVEANKGATTDKKSAKALLMIDWAPEKGCSLADRLNDNGIECDVIGVDFPLAKWTPMRKFFSHWSRCIAVGWKAFRLRKNYDYIIAWQQIMGFVFGFLKVLTRAKKPGLFILTSNITERKNPFFGWIRKMMVRLAWAGADEVGFYSEKLKNSVAASFNLPKKKAVHLPYTINVRNFQPEPVEKLESYIFSIGISYRDWKTLLAAAAKLPQRKFVLVTQEFTLQGLSVPENVECWHNTFGQKAKDLMSQASVILTPLQFTDSPAGEATLLEGMAFEKPSIVTRTVTTGEYVNDKIDGLLIPDHDADAMVEAIEYLYSNPESAQQIGKQARERVLEFYSMEAFAARIADIVRERLKK